VPRSPGHFCAFGMLHSDLRYDVVRTWFMRLDDVHFDDIAGAFAALAAEGKSALEKGRVSAGRVAVAHAVDMRYVGQEHPVTVALPARVLASGDREAVKKLFDAEHLRRYGTNAPSERAEVVSLRASVSGLMKKPPLERIARGRAPSPRARRRVYFGEAEQALQTPVYLRDALRAGNRIEGPALVEEDASTTVLLPGDRLRVDDFGNLDIEVARRRA
jgi:N-methylhydantoinase A